MSQNTGWLKSRLFHDLNQNNDPSFRTELRVHPRNIMQPPRNLFPGLQGWSKLKRHKKSVAFFCKNTLSLAKTHYFFLNRALFSSKIYTCHNFVGFVYVSFHSLLFVIQGTRRICKANCHCRPFSKALINALNVTSSAPSQSLYFSALFGRR